MTAKEYLTQAYYLDQRINGKLEQLMGLREIAVKATSMLSNVRQGGTRKTTRMEDTIVKIIELENEINRDIDRLVDLKFEIVSVIKSISNIEYQTVLELRYLCYKKWEQIAVIMGCGIDNVFKLHKKSLIKVAEIKSLE